MQTQVTCSCPKRLEPYIALKPDEPPLRFPGRAMSIGTHHVYVSQARKNGGHPDLVARMDGNDVIVTIDQNRPRRRRVQRP